MLCRGDDVLSSAGGFDEGRTPLLPVGLPDCRRTLWGELLEAQQRSRLHETHGFSKTCVSSRQERWNFSPGHKSEISRSAESRLDALRYSLESDLSVPSKYASRLHESTDLADLGVLGASSGAPDESYKALKAWY